MARRGSCRQVLSRCMRGKGGKTKARRCMKAFNRCRRRK